MLSPRLFMYLLVLQSSHDLADGEILLLCLVYSYLCIARPQENQLELKIDFCQLF